MKEYFLVPTFELEVLKKRGDGRNLPEKIKSKPEQKFFENESISKEDILELHNQINRLRRETEMFKNKNVTMDKDQSKVDDVYVKKGFNNSKQAIVDDVSGHFKLKNKNIIEENIPKANVKEGYQMLKDLYEKSIIKIDDEDNIINVKNNEKVKLRDFLRAIFIKEAKVSHISLFLKYILSKINQSYIRNRKALEMVIGKKENYDVEEDSTIDSEEEVFEESVGDEATLRGGAKREDLYISWNLL